jgi:hypothetical protein
MVGWRARKDIMLFAKDGSIVVPETTEEDI